MYIIRLDDASEYCDNAKWDKIEKILDKYDICPIVGVIPDNKDATMVKKYKKNVHFWDHVKKWENKHWIIAMHGHQHLYITNDGGINPVNKRSEFAGVALSIQKEKIKNAYNIFKKHEIKPKVFFAPSHTFDENTLKALYEETPIRIISDTIANDMYCENGFTFIPQQSGSVRKLPFKIVTFCYHPNTMSNDDFIKLENFLIKNKQKFICLDLDKSVTRTKRIIDFVLKKLYFIRRK